MGSYDTSKIKNKKHTHAHTYIYKKENKKTDTL